MAFSLQKIKNSLVYCSEYGINNQPHFHENYFSKEYYPIYGAFMLYSIIYVTQYVLFGFKWKRIIFDVVLGGVLGIIIYFTRRNTKYTQLYFTIFFMIGAILLHQLIIYDLKCHELLFLGLYICILYYNMIKGSNNILSNIAFFFMIMYLSVILLTDLEDLTTFFGNFTICLLQSYMTWTEHKYTMIQNEKQNNEKKMWMHIFNKVFPGITILFKKKNLDSQQKKIYYKLNDLVVCEFVNIRGQQNYKIENDIDNVVELLSQIHILNNQKQCEYLHFLKEPNTLTINQDYDSHNTENGISILTLLDLVSKAATETLFDNMILGYFKPNSKKMRIWITNFDWNNEKLLLIHLDDDNLEEEIKRLQENDLKKNELLASVTHDLRSPLNGILAFINNAKTSENKDDQSKFLNYAEINGNLLMSLINDILDYSSFLNEKFHLLQEKCSLNTIISDVMNLMTIQATSKKIKLKVENEVTEDLTLYTDSRRLKQILINLIGNSIKFTMKGFIKLKILKTSYKNILKFVIIDTGVGMKKETISKLCKPYSTFDTEEGVNKYGIGLGLNICKKFVSLLGPKNELHVTSEYGVGTKINFFIYIDGSNKGDYKLTHSASKKKFKILKANSEISTQLAPMLSNFSPKMLSCKSVNRNNFEINLFKNLEITKDIRKTQNLLNDSPVVIKSFYPKKLENQSFQNLLSFKELKCHEQIKHSSEKVEKVPISEKNESICKSYYSVEDHLHFSSFGSISNESDFEENLTGNIGKKIYNFEHPLERLKGRSMSTSLPFNKKISEIYYGSKTQIETNINKNQSNVQSSFRILIVDDNPFNSFVITSYLQKADKMKIYYDTASNGVECIKKFKEKNIIPNLKFFNLIFMDCLMPIKDGYEASIEIKSLIESKKYYNTIIIGITGLSGEEEESKCMKCGMDGLTSKPITEKQCFDLIYKYMNIIY